MKKKEEETIFNILFEKKVCFAVVTSVNTFKIKSVVENSREYFIIIFKNDLKHLRAKSFHRSTTYPNIFERELSISEIREFKTHIDKFTRVVNNQFGRVYELKTNSFKSLYGQDLYSK